MSVELVLGTSRIQLEDNVDNSSFDLKFLEDVRQLANVFPEEIWIIIIDKLNDNPQDLQQLSNASLYFRNLLLPKRIFFLFPEMLRAILPELLFDQTESDLDCVKDPRPFHEIRAAMYKRKTSIIMNFRSVCVMWSGMVEFYMKEHSVEDGYDFMRYKTANYFNATDPLARNSRFLRHFERSHPPNSKRSPFVQRSVVIDYRIILDRARIDPLFTRWMTTLLQTYGHHIWDLNFHTPVNFSYLKLRKWLLLMPNLHKLQVENTVDLKDAKPADEMKKLDTQVGENPLPQFHKLKTLNTTMLSPQVNQEIIRQSCNLTTIQIKPRRELQRLTSYDFFSLPLLKLESVTAYFCTQKDIIKIRHSENVSRWPLKSLQLLECEYEDFIGWAEIFQVIEDKWSATLETLCLDLPPTVKKREMISILGDSSTFRLNLPKLRTLELTFWNAAHLDFLLPMKDSLENLHIDINYSLVNKPDWQWQLTVELWKDINPVVVQFLGYENKMLTSNIWTLFPNLKTLSLSILKKISYTREEWKKHELATKKLEYELAQKKLEYELAQKKLEYELAQKKLKKKLQKKAARKYCKTLLKFQNIK